MSSSAPSIAKCDSSEANWLRSLLRALFRSFSLSFDELLLFAIDTNCESCYKVKAENMCP